MECYMTLSHVAGTVSKALSLTVLTQGMLGHVISTTAGRRLPVVKKRKISAMDYNRREEKFQANILHFIAKTRRS